MELQQWWRVLQRRWWIPVVLVVTTVGVSLMLAQRVNSEHTVQFRLAVSVPPEPREGPYFTYSGFYSWQASEYLTDDLSELLRSEMFARDVRAVLAQRGLPDVDPAIVQTARPQKTHRILSVTLNVPDPELGQRIADAIQTVITEKGREYVAQLGQAEAQVRLIDGPRVVPPTVGARSLLELGARAFLALLVGVGLAFLLHAVDPYFRERSEVEETLGLPVLAAIPAERAGRIRPTGRPPVLQEAQGAPTRLRG
jgi:capsular polysaccharide biosynthesis protein